MKHSFLVILIWVSVIAFPVTTSNRLITFNPPYNAIYWVDPLFPNYLVNSKGNHLFLLNRTAWTYFVCSYPHNVLKKAKEQGANIIRVAMEGTPYKSALSYDMWPWGGTRQQPDYSNLNEPYWTEVEHRIRMAGEQGIGINLTLYFTFKPTSMDIKHQQYYWKMILKRLAKYSNIVCWEIMNEYSKNEDFQDAAGLFFHQHDPYKRPVISSDGTTDDALWPQKKWMGMAIVHTCTGMQPAYDLQNWYNAIARNTRSHGKPAFNNESGREIRHKNDDGIHRRKQAWITNSAGCFWTHHTWDGCEGINDTTYRSPGEEYLKPMVGFFESIPFWTFQPNYTVCQLNNDSLNGSSLICNTLTGNSRNQGIVYICTSKTAKYLSGLKCFFRFPNGTYRLEFFEPATATKTSETEIVSTNLRNQYPVLIPNFIDDIVIKFTKVKQAAQTIIPGTE